MFSKLDIFFVTNFLSHYIASRKAAIDRGAKHYTALQCYNETGEAKREYDLGGDVSLEILYNYYYNHESPEEDENHVSVCVMLHNGDQQYLFTGDMEKEGEAKLVEHYAANPGGLGHCVLFKGAHHGSNTSNTDTLLNAIKPEYVCICTCCGSSQYTDSKGGQFPTQTTINAIAKYTKNVFATTLVTTFSDKDSDAKYEPLNGTIVFLANPFGVITIQGSNNSTPLKDTAWFKKNRTMPASWQ
jgi:beta-lactamase superfamily II metal-dependent hydrolase